MLTHPSPVRFSFFLLAFGLAACDRPDPPEPAAPPMFEGADSFMDDGAEDPSFAAFRDSLRAIVARQDTVALLEIVSDKAQLSYDDAPGGPDGLHALWFSDTAMPPEPCGSFSTVSCPLEALKKMVLSPFPSWRDCGPKTSIRSATLPLLATPRLQRIDPEGARSRAYPV